MMRKSLVLTLALGLSGAMLPFTGSVAETVNIGASFANGDLSGFYLGLSEYFHRPEREVYHLRERRIPDEEVPVALFIADRGRVALDSVVRLRLGGMSWLDIGLRYGVGPEVFYVPVDHYGPPYGHAYGYYRKFPRNRWHEIRLLDDDIINLVNLRFVSEHYRYDPYEVMNRRGRGNTYIQINNYVRVNRGHDHDRDDHHHDRDDRGWNGHDHDHDDHGHGHDRGHGRH